MYWYVFLMPDGSYKAQAAHSRIQPWESEAVDCWIIEALNESEAIEGLVRQRAESE